MLEAHQRLIKECEITYDEFACDYDRHLREECGYRSPERIAAAMARLDLGPAYSGSRPWLDLGAGTGLVGEAIVERDIVVEMVAVDVSGAMLEQIGCPLYVARHQVDVLRHLPVRPGSCAGAVAAGLMEYVLDARALLQRTGEAVLPGGWLLLTFCPNDAGRVVAFDEETDLHSHDGAMMEGYVAEAGFDLVRREEFPAYLNGEQGWIRHRLLVARRR